MADFLVASMYTDGYAERAARLRASCERHGLEHELLRVPAAHNSITRQGTPDAAYAKASVILDLLARRRRPVLWVDADCEFKEAPALVGELLVGGTEFAIYNWAADRQTEAYVPAPFAMAPVPGRSGPRFFRFASRAGFYDPSQRLCSGAVQLHADTRGARRLLEEWRRNLLRFEGAADDHCLDYTWNNRGPELAGLRASWLPKAYARYAWWIYVKPVIDHPEFAADARHFADIPETEGRRQFYPERAERLEGAPLIPIDRVVDVHARRLLRIEGKAIVQEEPTDLEFWT